MTKWLLLGFGLYGVSLLYLYFTQESFIFNSKAASFSSFTCKDCQRVVLNPQEGVELVGKARLSQSSKLLLYFGGNADDATAILKYLNPDLDMQVVAFNYRGYGESGGKPTQEALFSDSLAIYDTFAKDKQVIVMGRSLGTGVATYLASKRQVSHLVLITPYDSIRAIAKAKYPYFPIDLLIRHPFESTQYTPKIQAEVRVVEVLGDRVVPNEHTANLLLTIPNLSLHVKIENITHGEVLSVIDFNTLLAKL